MKKPNNNREYVKANTGLTPDFKKKATRKTKKRTIAKENKPNGPKSNT